MSKFEEDVFWKDGSEIKTQVVIPFRSFELNKFIRDHIETSKHNFEVIGFKFEGNNVEIICNKG
jgi:hypothetical protein